MKYVVYGGGVNGRTFYKRMHDKIDIVCFSDGKQSLQGTDISIDGDNGIRHSVPCIAPENIDKNLKIIVAAAPAYYPEISKKLQGLQLEHVSVDRFVYEYFADTIKYIEECLADDESRSIYHQIIENRKNTDLRAMRALYSTEQYFAIPEFVDFSGHEIFVDAGSFCGDILDGFIYSRCGLFKRIYAFEPGKKQFTALEHRAERLRREWALEEEQIICVNGAVSDYNGFCCFEVNADNLATSRMEPQKNAAESVPIYKLDDFLPDGADFIKADVEGQELALLKGAEKIIQKYRPKLAICLYHTPFDMFEIPAYIKKVVPDYKMEVRHHTHNMSETVLYAYCE